MQDARSGAASCALLLLLAPCSVGCRAEGALAALLVRRRLRRVVRGAVGCWRMRSRYGGGRRWRTMILAAGTVAVGGPRTLGRRGWWPLASGRGCAAFAVARHAARPGVASITWSPLVAAARRRRSSCLFWASGPSREHVPVGHIFLTKSLRARRQLLESLLLNTQSESTVRYSELSC